ncbi:MAG TPA: helix-turn-helix transcriptional regulator [Bacillales bacterium]|nr:helix-turn-helix transcriptional regulator [Bacillales bacterium]HEU5141287.1 helix-turn-helix transcriptional regulator [Bacillales bacterium]
MEAEQWGRKIRAFRKLKGHTQESLAQEMNVSVSVIGEIERGNRFPSEKVLEDVADILNVTVKDLTPDEEEKNA